MEQQFDNKVFVQCMTYNHVNYIEDAMHGFVMQQTDFPYVAVVVDDASTDGEPEVIKRFLEKEFDMASAVQDETEEYVRVVAKHKSNVNLTFVVVFLKYNHYSIRKPKWKYYWNWSKNAKYIALCEGDDYWTDPLKLQKQVDFLEVHEKYCLCFHNSIVKEEKTGALRCFHNSLDKNTFSLNDAISLDWFIPTQSLVYRRSVYVNNKVDGSFFNGDMFLILTLLRNGGLAFYFDEIMGVYRFGVGVSSHDVGCINSKRLIELFTYMKDFCDPTYHDAFDKRIEEFKKDIMDYERYEYQIRHSQTPWFKIRLKILRLFKKCLCLHNPNVKIEVCLTDPRL